MRLIKLAIFVSNLAAFLGITTRHVAVPHLTNSELVCNILSVVYCSNLELASVSRRLGSLKRCITIVAGDPRSPGCGGGSISAFV